MGKGGCLITYPVDGHKENTLKSAIRLGVNKVILMDKSNSYKNLFDKFGLVTDFKIISTDDVNLVVNSVSNLISEAKNEQVDINVLLLPSDPIITTGVYIASCMEKVKVIAQISGLEMKYLNLPLFPFVNLNDNERFILTKIIQSNEVSTKKLFSIIEKEGYCSKLCSRSPESTAKKRSELRQLQRILNKLEKIELIKSEKRDNYFIWSSTLFSKLTFGYGNE